MTRWQRTLTVQVRADFILAYGPSARAYAIHFETQMSSGRAHRLRTTLCLRFIRARAWLARCLPGIGRQPASVRAAVR